MRSLSAADRRAETLTARGARRAPYAPTRRALFVVIACLPAIALAGAPGPEDAVEETPITSSAPASPRRAITPRPVLDPSARLLAGNDASEAWTLYVELDGGHRVTQRFMLTNAGPGSHNAVAIGHLVEPGRAPYRYENGRRRRRWTLSEDRLFFDIAASHLDLHRPKAELRITKDDIEIRLFFDFGSHDPAASIPADRLPPGYHVELLAVGAATQGTLLAPWMSEPLAVRGRAWLVHTWSEREEARLLARRVEIFGHENRTSFYGVQLRGRGDWQSGWSMVVDPTGKIIEPAINVTPRWNESPKETGTQREGPYPTPGEFEIENGTFSGQISLGGDWLRFDPLEVIPQPFRWFIKRSSRPQEVWADAQIGVSLSSAPEPPSLPHAGETTSARRDTETLRANRETDREAALRSVTGVASITFLNPTGRR